MMKSLKYTLLISALLVFTGAFAQKKMSKDEKERLANAEIYYEITDYKRALKLFERLLEKDVDNQNLNYKIGVCHFYMDDNKSEAFGYLKKSRKLGNMDALFFIGQCYHLQEKFSEARKSFEEYKAYTGDREFTDEEVNRHIAFIDNAEQLQKNPVKVSIYNIGEKVNSKFPDYGPLIPADESIMIFTSRRPGSTGDKIGPYGKYFEDIYIATNVDGKFEETRNIGMPVNTTTHDAAVGLSADGKTLIIYKTNRAQTGGDLYFSHFIENAWTKPKKFSEMINSEYQEPSATLSPDGNTMYFTSTRKGGYGGRDIYRAVLLPSGDWSLPMNMGSNINSPYDEDGPFIHPDGKTLFFSSNGHNSMGAYDVFKSTFNGEYWGAPTNMGYPINSVGNDVYFVLAANGKRGYYSTYNEQDSSNHDIYVISFEDELQQLKIIKGSVFSSEGKTPLNAKIKLYNSKNKIEGEFNTNQDNGSFIVLVKPDKNYKMVIESDGYESHSEELLFDGGRLMKEYSRDVVLNPKK